MNTPTPWWPVPSPHRLWRSPLRAAALLLRGALLAALALPTACLDGSASGGECTPGQHTDCGCSQAAGVRVCEQNGMWSACLCNAPPGCRLGESRVCTCERQWGRQSCVGVGSWGACACPISLPRGDGGTDCPCADGCCGDGVCRVGSSPDACGPIGQVCASCAAGEVCLGQRCRPASPSGLSLVIVSASLPSYDPTKRGCSNWDCFTGTDSAPDAFVRSTDGRFRSATASNDYEPVWDEVVATGLTPEELAAPIELDLLDDDAWPASTGLTDESDLIAHFRLQLRPEQIAPGRFELTAGQPGPTWVSLLIELRPAR